MAVAVTFAIVAFAPGLNVWPVCLQLYFVVAVERIKMTTIIHRGARAPLMNVRVCLEPNETMGSEFRFSPRRTTLPL